MEQAHVDTHAHRITTAHEKAEGEPLRQQLCITRDEGAGEQQRTIAEHESDQYVTPAQTIGQLTEHDGAEQRAGPLRRIQRSRLQQTQIIALAQERPQNIDRVPSPTVKELAAPQQQERHDTASLRQVDGGLLQRPST